MQGEARKHLLQLAKYALRNEMDVVHIEGVPSLPPVERRQPMVLAIMAFTLIAVNMDLDLTDVLLLAVAWRAISRR